ncbi:hypothetical protein RRF57_013419 [Xylaria bambusicola]|uniref:Uncharacterized protein n=1 Tax=Xylaria bambusicola TaxID=326684 RepID=A0AAN7UZB3_9PEZI
MYLTRLTLMLVLLDNAGLEAQAVGKSPELCNPDSNFMMYYNACGSCVNAHTDDPKAISDIEQTFSVWLNYCESLGNSTTVGGSTVAGGPPATITDTALTAVPVLVTVPFTVTTEGMTSVWPLTKTLTSYAPLPSITLLSVTTTEDGHTTIWLFTKTLTPLPSDEFIDASPTSLSTIRQTSQVSNCM